MKSPHAAHGYRVDPMLKQVFRLGRNGEAGALPEQHKTDKNSTKIAKYR
jgi:hypothetical protein